MEGNQAKSTGLAAFLFCISICLAPLCVRAGHASESGPDSLSQAELNSRLSQDVRASLGSGTVLFTPGASPSEDAQATMIAPTLCNDPLTGKNVVIDAIQSGTVCLLCNDPNIKNLIDGDLSNYVSFNPALTLLATSVVSIKDISQFYNAGTRTGFVIQPQGGLLGTGLLGSFQIRTYLNNVLQETVTGSSNLSLNVLGASGGKQRISFVSTLNFDEVELVQTSVINAFSSLRVYYAFVEPIGCDYDCVTQVITGSAYNPSIVAARTGLVGGACVICGVSNSGFAIDANTTNFANLSVTVGIGAVMGLSVKANAAVPIPAGYDAGFVIRDESGLGLLSATVLGGISINTYLGGSPRETANLSNLVDLTVLGGNLQSISFKTTLSFDEIQLIVNTGTIGALANIRAYYAFVRPDSDNDGFVDCVDKCAGQNDNLDADGDGIPDGCDNPVCTSVNAGVDLTVCPPASSAQLPAAGMGQTWAALPGNPSAAAVNAAGAVSGLSAEGIYGFVLTEGLCKDTVYLSYQYSNLDASCNDPITGYGVIIDQVGLTGGICILCGGGSAAIDGDLSNYTTYTIGVGVLTATSIISVKDTTQVYPVGTRTGFVVEPVGGLLDATALSTLQIRTYLNNVLQETATVGNGLLGASALVGNGNKQRLSFVTTQTFDEVELVTTSVIGLLSSIRVYYAFEEPSGGCPDLGNGALCANDLIASNPTFCGQIAYDHTGITGVVCAACSVNQIGNLIDPNTNNATVINLTAGVAASGQVSVKTRQVIPGGYTAGYRISSTANLLDASVLAGITIRTYLNGAPRDNFNGSGGLLNVVLLNSNTGYSQISFVTTQTFDEVQLVINGLVNALATTNVYGAFVYGDADGDGSPDCIDKCCGSPDYLDSNGDGQPNGCDPFPVPVNDMVSVNEDQSIDINVLANDSFGPDGPGTIPVSIVVAPMHGTAVVNNHGTPNDPTDDTIIYTPNANYTGNDVLVYSICDIAGDCASATIFIIVDPVNDAPVANPDPYTVNEDTPLSGNVALNDFDVDGPTVVVSIVTPPTNGVLMMNPDGTFTYTPNPNYSGSDSFVYSYCDGGTPNQCDQATVTISVNAVNDAPDAVDDSYMVTEDNVLMGNVTNNDTDPDGPTVIINVVTPPTNGVLVLNGDGTFTYTPDPNYSGSDSYVYSYCDGGTPNQCDQATVTISVNAVNDAPDAVDDSYMVTEDNVLMGNVTNNDTDPDGPMVIITVVTPPMNGVLMMNGDGTFTYTPDPNYSGSDSYVYSYCDGGTPNQCDQATVTISVNAVNDAPDAVDDSYMVTEDNVLMGNVANNDTDPDGPMVNITVVTPPANGMLVLNTDGSFTYAPNNGFTGTDGFVYSYCDGGTPDLCDMAQVTLNVEPATIFLNLKVALQGALLGNVDGYMRDNLRSPINYLPVQEPYSSLSSFTHVNGGGGETVTNPATVFAVNGPDAIVDWVFIELRSSSNMNNVVATRSAMLQRDGDVVDVDGVSAVHFTTESPASYYVSVRHRNHLGAMTATAVALSSVGTVVDFTDINTPLWDDGTNLDGYEEKLIGGKLALWAANSNSNTDVVFAGQSNDKDAVFNQIDQAPGNILKSQTYIRNGYFTGDNNLSSQDIFAGQNNDVDLIFNNVDTHPRNILHSQTFIIREQLPHQ